MSCPYPKHVVVDLSDSSLLKLRALGKFPDGWVERLNTGKRIILAPCGHCPQCKRNKSREWSIRLSHENSYSRHAYFITLTYSDDNLPSNGSIDMEEVSKFIKRVREDECTFGNTRKKAHNVKYYAVGEYGSVESRPHYHLLVFSDTDCVSREAVNSWWKLGRSSVDPVSVSSICYVAGYVDKKIYGNDFEFYKERGISPPGQRVSNGIGLRWCLDNADYLRNSLTIKWNGVDVPIPRYYRKKLDIDYIGYQLQYDAIQRSAIIKQGLNPDSEEDLAKFRQLNQLHNEQMHEDALARERNKKFKRLKI